MCAARLSSLVYTLLSPPSLSHPRSVPLQLRASRVAARWAAKITLSFYTITIIRCTVIVLIAAHWFACTFALQAALNDRPSRTFLGIYGYCHELTPAQISLLGTTDYIPSSAAWKLEYASPLRSVGDTGPHAATHLCMHVHRCADLGIGEYYVASLTWSVLVITGTGGTDAYPSPYSIHETCVVVVLVLMGSILWTQAISNRPTLMMRHAHRCMRMVVHAHRLYTNFIAHAHPVPHPLQILASFCDIATNSDPGETAFRQVIIIRTRMCSCMNLRKHA